MLGSTIPAWDRIDLSRVRVFVLRALSEVWPEAGAPEPAGARLLVETLVDGESRPRNARVLGVSECSDLAVIDLEGLVRLRRDLVAHGLHDEEGQDQREADEHPRHVLCFLPTADDCDDAAEAWRARTGLPCLAHDFAAVAAAGPEEDFLTILTFLPTAESRGIPTC